MSPLPSRLRRRPSTSRRTLGLATSVVVLAGVAVPLAASADHAPAVPFMLLSAPESQTFTPDGDGVEETVTVAVELGEQSTVTYRLEDAAGAVLVPSTQVSTVLDPQAGWAAPFTWNGGGKPIGQYSLFWAAEGSLS